MTQLMTGAVDDPNELRARIAQIEFDLARILRGMDASRPAPQPGSQAFAFCEGPDPRGGQASAHEKIAALREGFECKPADVEPQHFAECRARYVRSLIRQRRQRERHFPADMFADPAWDMMLDLYAGHYEGQPDVCVSSLCIAAAVPPTTALRWIKSMTDDAIFSRQADPDDGRRILIRLSEKSRIELDRYFNRFDG